MAGHHDPRLLYSIPNIKAYHLQDGEESSLNPSGPQTLSLLMVPTNSAFADLGSANAQDEAPEEDFYLHLHLPPELDLPLPATTQIYHQPPHSYLIPRWDLGPDSGAFTRIEFPKTTDPADVDTFETILAQCTAFLERAAPPVTAKYPQDKKSGSGGYGEKGSYGQEPPAYNPQNFAPGEGYVSGTGGSGSGGHQHGHIVLIDEENGSVVGELSEGFSIVEDSDLKHGSKSMCFLLQAVLSKLISYFLDPVEIQLPTDPKSNRISVSNIHPSYLADSMHPAYKNSSLVARAQTASRLIVTASSTISNALQSGAESFTQKTKPLPQPMTFTPTTHDRVRKINSFTEGAAGISSKTVGQVSKYAQNIGATLARKGEKERKEKGVDAQGHPIDGYKPGILNKSLMAFSTIADGIDHASRSLLVSGSTAATTVVGHRYGDEAKQLAAHIGGGVKNVGLVYVDATGVSRKAVVKSVAKGMVVGKVKGGGDLIVGGGDGGDVTGNGEWDQKAIEAGGTTGSSSGINHPPAIDGFGSRGGAPPAYGSGVGEPLEGQSAYPRDNKSAWG
jgi:spartin